MTENNTIYGHFDLSHGGTYVITNVDEIIYPWEYIYQNKDILLRVDQYGAVNCQANPPHDIMLFKRSETERHSKWIMSFTCDEFHGGLPFSNFENPISAYLGEKPQSKIVYSPEKAEYFRTYSDFSIKTEFFVPLHGTEAVMRTSIKNISGAKRTLNAFSSMYPYVNKASVSAWDKYEWYLKTSVAKKNDKTVFFTKLFSSRADSSERRFVSFTSDMDGNSTAEISLEKYEESGDFLLPSAFKKGRLNLKPSDFSDEIGEWNGLSVYGYPPVYACCAPVELNDGESRVFTQVLKMYEGENYSEKEYSKVENLFDGEKYDAEIRQVQDFYQKLFSERSIKTGKKIFDYYVNTFVPLQMYWVACLDRGWPNCMRGTRDASNDFIGVLSFDAAWSRRTLLQLVECQRKSDGWFPRQVSSVSRKGKHDFRNFCDGGVFVLEFIYEYLTQSRDYTLFNEQSAWVDDDDKSPFLEHILKAFDYYLCDENNGEHGLIKIHEGDWLDSVNRAGVYGRGESVMATMQLVMSLKLIPKVLDKACKKGFINIDVEKLQDKYNTLAERYKQNINESAFNKNGFYNSVFNDDGFWLFSDKDPDGKERVYGPVNSYAVISGVADDAQREKVWQNIDKLKYPFGYKLFCGGLGEKPIAHHGRMASGDIPIGLWANDNMYNHGSHGFLGRALTADGRNEQAADVLMCMFPYDEEHHPVSVTKSAPYAIVNCYQNIPYFYHRAASPFLTGSVAMSLRYVYNWIFGISYDADGLIINPCVCDELNNAEVSFDYCGKRLKLIIRNNAESKKCLLGGKEVSETKKNEFNGKSNPFIAFEDLKDNDVIEIFLQKGVFRI